MIALQSGGTGSLAGNTTALISLTFPAGSGFPPVNNTPQNMPAVLVSVTEVGAASGAVLVGTVVNVSSGQVQVNVRNVTAIASNTFVVTALVLNTPGQAQGI